MVERTATTESGWDVLDQGDWKRARKLFAAAGESAEALEGLGLAAWWLDEESALDARERASRLYRERGDSRGAGRVATWLAWDYNAFRGERAIANGWLQRARRLLEGLEPCAEQGWLERLAQLPVAQGNRALSALCRAHYGSVLALRGSWAAAERELVGATDTLAVTRPGDAGDGLARLGELRRRQGRLDEAEGALRKAEPHPLARFGEAALALERGRPLEAAEAAAAVAEPYGGRLRLERAAALELLARANAALGELDRAAAYADDLEELALVAGSGPLRASAASARATIAVAAGDLDGARRLCTSAVDLLRRLTFRSKPRRRGSSSR